VPADARKAAGQLKPPFSYFGSKLSIAPRIAALLPPHGHYVEPFAGSLAVLLAKRPSPMETVNDLDGNLMCFWQVLRDRPGDLERACALTPHSRAEHDAAFAMDGDDLERARKVWVLLTQGRGGHLPPRRSGWRHYQDPQGPTSMPAYLGAYLGRMAGAVERLRGVSLECRPAAEVIERYGRHDGVLIYADPPYLASVRTLNNGRGRGPDYAHELRTDEEHGELAASLRAARAAVVLSGYDSPLYAELYGDWHRLDLPGLAGNGTDAARTEVLWSNRPFPRQETLFDGLEAS
jgi:DNA adenine methylase